MALVRHDPTRREVTPSRRLDFFDRFFDDFPEVFRRPVLLWPERGAEALGVEEYTENGTLVIRVELPGVDPEKDVELSVEDGILHLAAQRREEELQEGRDYVRRELRYGSFHRDLALPKGAAEDQIGASYKDGILEVRVPMAKDDGAGARRVEIAKG